MNKQHILFVAIAAAVTGMTGATASALVTGFNNGTLVLGFNATGGAGVTDSLEVAIGTAASYRDATSNVSNIVNIGALLSATYGSNWYERSDLLFGLGTTTTNVSPGVDPTLVNGDPGRTVYVTKARNTAGTELVAGSTINNSNATTLGNSASAFVNLQNGFVTNGTGTVIGGIGAASVIPESTANTFEDFTPISGAHFGFVSSPGAVQAFGTGTLAGFSAGNVEGALDLYRFQAANNISGQYNAGQPNNTGFYEGFFTIDNGGNVSFQVGPVSAVPEPSMILAGVAPILGMALRRRRSVVAA